MVSSLRSLSMNERKLVELVFRQGRIARIDLSAATGMTAASVTRLIAGLKEMGLFAQKTEQKVGARGQPKRLLSLRANKLISCGIYIYLDKIVAVLVNLDGKVLATKEEVLKSPDAAELAGITRKLTEYLLQKANVKGSHFLGIGLSIPGNFGSYSNLVRAHEMFPELDGSSFYEAARRNCPWPVFLENDGTASAVGEYLFGGHKSADPLFLVHIGYGLGGGAVLNGRPFQGANGNACLPGALFPYDSPRPTLQDLQTSLASNGIDLGNVAVDDELLANPILTEWVSRAANQLGYAVRVITGMFDPKVIVLGGPMPQKIIDRIASELNSGDIGGPSRGLVTAPVVATGLGDLVGPIGAASIPFFSTLFPGSSQERGNRYLNGRSAKTN